MARNSSSEVVRLAIGIFAGSRPAALYCRCSATTQSPTTVEKMTFGSVLLNFSITELNSEWPSGTYSSPTTSPP